VWTDVVRSAQFATSPEEMIQWCRSTACRRLLRGSGTAWRADNDLFYHVALRSPGLEEAELHVEEHLRDVYRDGDGRLVFDSDHRWLWPNGLYASAVTTYAVLPGDPNKLEFTLRYLLPGSAVSTRLNHRRFLRTMERVCEFYVASIVEAMGNLSASRASAL
jgi:hypothetical protein